MKNYLELLSAYDSIKSMGTSVAERCGNQSFRKSEQVLMTCFARAAKFEKQLQGIKAEHMAENIEKHTKAMTQLKEVINSHYDYFSKSADNKLSASLEKLKPLSKGLPDGKSWKEGVQESFFMKSLLPQKPCSLSILITVIWLNHKPSQAEDQSFFPHAVVGFLLISQSKTTQD